MALRACTTHLPVPGGTWRRYHLPAIPFFASGTCVISVKTFQVAPQGGTEAVAAAGTCRYLPLRCSAHDAGRPPPSRRHTFPTPSPLPVWRFLCGHRALPKHFFLVRGHARSAAPSAPRLQRLYHSIHCQHILYRHWQCARHAHLLPPSHQSRARRSLCGTPRRGERDVFFGALA